MTQPSKLSTLLKTLGAFCVWAVVYGISLTPVQAQETDKGDTVSTETVDPAPASDNGDPTLAVTVQNPNIPVDELQLRLLPLTRSQLEHEAIAWSQILQNQVEAISAAEIAIKQQNQNPASSIPSPTPLLTPSPETAPETSSEPSAIATPIPTPTAITDAFSQQIRAFSQLDKTDIVARVSELQAERTAIVDRFTVVLDELDKKGGDGQSYRDYIQASSGIVIDFQDTQGLGFRLVSWLKSEEGGVRLLLAIGRFVGIIFGFWILGVLLNRAYNVFHERVLRQKFEGQVLPIISTVSHTMIWLLIIVMGLGTAGLEISAIVAGLGVGGLAVALAAQDTLSNFLGGLTLLIQGKVALGQRVEIDGIKAKVQEIGLRTTTLVELEYGYQVVVPNRKFLQDVVSYIDTRPNYAVYEKLYLHPHSSWEQIDLALKLIQQVAEENPYISGARPSFSDYAEYAFELKFVFWIEKWLPEEQPMFPNDLWKMYQVRSQMNAAILKAFEANSLKLALPIKMAELPETDPKGIFQWSNHNI